MLHRRFLLAAAAAATLSASPAAAQVEIQWWHAMTGANNQVIVRLAEEFNARSANTGSCRPTRAPMPTP